jgi:hypothetical protein
VSDKEDILIVNFMGLEITPNGDKCTNPKYLDGTVSPIQFKSSWDWLMPVIKKLVWEIEISSDGVAPLIDGLMSGLSMANIQESHALVLECLKQIGSDFVVIKKEY